MQQVGCLAYFPRQHTGHDQVLPDLDTVEEARAESGGAAVDYYWAASWVRTDHARRCESERSAVPHGSLLKTEKGDEKQNRTSGRGLSGRIFTPLSRPLCSG